jgi:hypothetical protein
LSDKSYDIRGKPISEEEVAADLGFKDVHDLRRWSTEQGRKILDLEYALRTAEGERDRFRWHMRRMMVVLRKIRPIMTDPELFLAIGVVCGESVDWKNELKDWWEEGG